jgi:chromosome segregation ATPase
VLNKENQGLLQRTKDAESKVAALEQQLEALQTERDDWQAEVSNSRTLIDGLRSQVESLKRDGERYRWLRDGGSAHVHVVSAEQDEGGTWVQNTMHGEGVLDKVIDAARSPDGGEG